MKNKSEIKKKTGIARLLEIAGEKRGLLVLSGIFSVLSALAQLVPFAAIYFIVEELLKNAANPGLVDKSLIQFWGLWALISLVASLVFLYASTMASHVSAFRILYGLRLGLAEHLAKLPMGYHTRQSTGTIKKILEFSVEKIESFIAHQLPDFIAAAVTPVVMLTVMFSLDWRLALSCAVPIVAAFLLQMLSFLGKKGREDSRRYNDALEEMNATGVEYVRGMPAVKVFGMTVSSFLKFHNTIENYRVCAMNISRTYKSPYAVFFVLLSSLLSFILPVGVFILSGQPDNQAFALMLLLFLVLGPGLSLPVLKLLYLGGNLRQVSEGVERVDGIFAMQPVAQPETPGVPENYTVEFDTVRFSYDEQDAATRVDALTGVSFTAREKEMTALVGPSGSGKSTIANLIPRFWDVASGAIRIGGVDIRDMDTEKLMDAVSFVFQDVHLFYDTIEENIRMGRTDATKAQIVEAAKKACCHEFIKNLPQGYQTKIGEGGTYLSGGEAQRVSIARALLKDSPILVLDEATSFADPENEAKIQQGLSELIRGKTVIIIAHRLSTIREADQILVINEGQIVQRGRHDALAGQEGLYRRMWEAHIDAGAWAISKESLGKAAQQ